MAHIQEILPTKMRMTAKEFRAKYVNPTPTARERLAQCDTELDEVRDLNEHQLQVECVRWFRESFPEYSDLFWATPNGGYRSEKTAADMKAEGQLSGVPDLFLALPLKGYFGLFIEMKKSRKGKNGGRVGCGHTSDNQDRVIARLKEAGYKVEICYSIRQFKEIIRNYLYKAV